MKVQTIEAEVERTMICTICQGGCVVKTGGGSTPCPLCKGIGKIPRPNKPKGKAACFPDEATK